MSSDRYTQNANIKAAERRRVLADLNELADDINRCDKTIGDVMGQLEAVNKKYQGERSTRQEVEYLTILLDCAKKKLAWEKQIASLKKRAPVLLERMTKVMTDEHYPPSEEMKADMLQCLKSVQAALSRLQAVETPPAE